MLKTILKTALKFISYKTRGVLGFVRKTFLLSAISLMISVTALIVLDSISNGYKENLKKKLLDLEYHIEIISHNLLKNPYHFIASLLRIRHLSGITTEVF